jgi:hypothetical protein
MARAPAPPHGAANMVGHAMVVFWASRRLLASDFILWSSFFLKIDVLKILKLFDQRKIWVSNFPELDSNIMGLARKPSKSLKTMVVTPNMWDIYIIKFKIHRYISDVSDT